MEVSTILRDNGRAPVVAGSGGRHRALPAADGERGFVEVHPLTLLAICAYQAGLRDGSAAVAQPTAGVRGAQ